MFNIKPYIIKPQNSKKKKKTDSQKWPKNTPTHSNKYKYLIMNKILLNILKKLLESVGVCCSLLEYVVVLERLFPNRPRFFFFFAKMPISFY